MIWRQRPCIVSVEVQSALALPDGRTPVILRLSGWGMAWVGTTRRWFWGPQTWRALVPVPGNLEVRLRNVWTRAECTVPLPGAGPKTPRIVAPRVRIQISPIPGRLRTVFRLPVVPHFDFSIAPKEPSHE